MAKQYSPELRKYIEEHVRGASNKELADMVNKKFGLKLSAADLRAYKCRHKLDSGYHPFKPPAGLEAFVRNVACGKSVREITALINEEFGAGTITEAQTHSYMSNRGIVSERRKRKIGDTFYSSQGYRIQKVSNTGSSHEKWRHEHVKVWEDHNGPVPDGYMLIFADGNKGNCDIGNLMLIRKSTNLARNMIGLQGSSKEETESILAIAKTQEAINAAKKRI